MTNSEIAKLAMTLASAKQKSSDIGPEEMLLGRGALVRVEMHGVPHDDNRYEKLHKKMAENLFLRDVEFAGADYEMPHATYLIRSTSTASDIKKLARTVVRQVVANDEDASITVEGPSDIVASRLRRKKTDAEKSATARLRSYF